jgi:hypothetical protein
MSFRYALWATVPSARVSAYANAAATSAFRGATAPEIAAIQAGQVVEKVEVFQAPIGTSIATIQAALIAAFNTFQGQITAFNPTQRYGTSWDGSAWTVAGTA